MVAEEYSGIIDTFDEVITDIDLMRVQLDEILYLVEKMYANSYDKESIIVKRDVLVKLEFFSDDLKVNIDDLMKLHKSLIKWDKLRKDTVAYIEKNGGVLYD